MTINSKTLLITTTHGDNSDVETVTGEKVKGDGYYSRSDGLHTVQYTYTSLEGEIKIQASLSVNPVEEDWFTVFSKSFENQTGSEITNFVGNYVWVRAQVIFTDGAINLITLNN
jgi:hypothetical protein